jgi:hypothetical protein
MTYDEQLADRIRAAIEGEPGLSEKKMFGGLAFLVRGNMAVAASGQGGLMVRIDPADADELTEGEHVERMEMRGRAMAGWLRVGVEAVGTAEELQAWVDRGVEHARSLPAKGER